MSKVEQFRSGFNNANKTYWKNLKTNLRKMIRSKPRPIQNLQDAQKKAIDEAYNKPGTGNSTQEWSG